jgi:hypothetical protein
MFLNFFIHKDLKSFTYLKNNSPKKKLFNLEKSNSSKCILKVDFIIIFYVN